MLMFIMQNMTNNTMYIIQDCVQWNCIQSPIISHFIPINIFITSFKYFIYYFIPTLTIFVV